MNGGGESQRAGLPRIDGDKLGVGLDRDWLVSRLSPQLVTRGQTKDAEPSKERRETQEEWIVLLFVLPVLCFFFFCVCFCWGSFAAIVSMTTYIVPSRLVVLSWLLFIGEADEALEPMTKGQQEKGHGGLAPQTERPTPLITNGRWPSSARVPPKPSALSSAA